MASLTLIMGATGAGKTAELRSAYRRWVESGVRTDQVLVLTADSARAAQFRQGLGLPASGPVRAYNFYRYIQQELNLFWADLQAAEPSLRAWVQPLYLEPPVAAQVMQGLLEGGVPTAFEAPGASAAASRSSVASAGLLGGVLLAPVRRLAAQLSGQLRQAAAAGGLGAREAAARLAAAAMPEKEPVYEQTADLVDSYRARCLQAGMLDYSLALELYSRVLLSRPAYWEHLTRRYRYLLVDHLDETGRVQQEFLERLAGRVDEAVFAYDTDGGRGRARGADPEGALSRFLPGARVLNLAGSHTCSPEAFRLGEALAERVRAEEGSLGPWPAVGAGPEADGEAPATGLPPGTTGAGLPPAEWLNTDLRGDLIQALARRVAGIIAAGTPPEAIAILTPMPDRPLEAALRRAVGRVNLLRPTRRLLDEPPVKALLVLAGLVQPQWSILRQDLTGAFLTAGPLEAAFQTLLGLDPIRAALLAEGVRERGGDLPDLHAAGLAERLSPEQARRYGALRDWVAGAREQEWETGAFLEAAVTQVLSREAVPSLEVLQACRQWLETAYRFRLARERFGERALGPGYTRLLTESLTLSLVDGPAPLGQKGAVVVATPEAYLAAGLTSAVQVWFDLSADAWLPQHVKELVNPYLLAQPEVSRERWTDRHSRQARREGGAAVARALMRRCTGRVLLAQCGYNPWGQEQEGGLAEAFSDLLGGESAPAAAPAMEGGRA